MIKNAFCGFTLCVVLMGIVPTRVLAQADRDSIAVRNDCKRVEQIFKTGHPTAQVYWAVNHVADCGQLGGSWAGVFVASLGPSYSPEAGDAVMYLAAQVRSAEIFQASLSLARTATTNEGRVAGLLIALRQVMPEVGWTLERLLDARPGYQCAEGYISARGPTELSPLPADARDQLKAASEAVAASAGTEQLRNAAGCVLHEMRIAQMADSL